LLCIITIHIIIILRKITLHIHDTSIEDDVPKIDQIIQSKVYEDTDVMDDDVEDIQAIAVMIILIIQ